MKFRVLLEKMNSFKSPVSARFIAKQFNMTIPHAHQDLKRLYRMGFVSRKKHPEDRRKYVYWVNKKGKKYIEYLKTEYSSDQLHAIELLSEIRKSNLYHNLSPETRKWLKKAINKRRYKGLSGSKRECPEKSLL